MDEPVNSYFFLITIQILYQWEHLSVLEAQYVNDS